MGQWQRPRLVPGIYDELISERVDAQLQELGPAFAVLRKELPRQDLAVSALTTLLRDAVELALAEQGDSEQSLKLATGVLRLLQEHAPSTFRGLDELSLRRERLEAIVPLPAQAFERPRGSLHTSSLIVNAEGDALVDHLRSEFDSADRIDLLCAFVKLSGIEKFRAVLERHCSGRGRPLRVLTTTYMQASEAKAIERLAALPNVEVRVSFDEESTRLHAKAWMFHRASGMSTAYVGSSNLSHAAQTEGLEGERLSAWERLVRLERPSTERELRLMRMLFVMLYGKQIAASEEAWTQFAAHGVLRDELAQLGPVLRRRSGILSEPHRLSEDVPLVLHARYLGAELSVAFDQRTKDGEFRDYYTGVETTSDRRHDLLLTTLQKAASVKEHLRYRDFPLNERQFHWQSKARTIQDSQEGQRLITPAAMGCTPLLFVRDRSDERPGVTMAFQYLGPVAPLSVEGERPVTIVWNLLHPMPMDTARHGRVAA